MKKILYMLGAAILGVLPVSAQNTKILTADKHNEYGLIYSLPVTTIQFEVKARHTVRKAGPFYQYAKKFLSTQNPVTNNTDEWEILSVTATPVGVADTDTTYLMQFKAGALNFISVAEDGMLLAINKEVEAPKGAEKQSGKPLKPKTKIDDYLQYVNEDFLASQSSAKQAQMLSESIMEVRDARISLTRGTAETMPTDGKQLELMLNSLNDQEAALVAAFNGTSDSEIVYRTYTYCPEPGDEEGGAQTLFRFSDFAGFVDADDYSGDPVNVSLSIDSYPTLPVDAKGEEKKLPKDAIMYNIPADTKVALSLKGNTLWSGNVPCAQFGMQFGLAPSLFNDKKNRSYAVFNPATGAVVEIGTLDAE